MKDEDSNQKNTIVLKYNMMHDALIDISNVAGNFSQVSWKNKIKQPV